MQNNNSKILGSITYIAVYLLLTGLCFTPVFGQHFITKEFDQQLKIGVAPFDSAYLILTGDSTTGIVARTDVNEIFEGAYIIIENDTLLLTSGDDGDRSELGTYSNLLTFSPPIHAFRFYPGNILSPVTFYFINAQLKKPSAQTHLVKKKSTGCTEPEMIDQSEWREGLNEPDYERIPNRVHNIIIHHSAGSNSDTDYINVVRNIYIYHTEVRGWSDIGYNYLIAQDGTIIKGRDPGGLEQNEVLGAHFCNSNTGTLGICALGTYSQLKPSEETFQSLVELITWELGKDSLDPFGIYPHPLNQDLPVIAGHRDGCATECPGDSLYYFLNLVRNLVNASFENCGYSIKPLSMDFPKEKEIRILCTEGEIIIFFQEPHSGSLAIYDLLGRKYNTSISFLDSDRIKIAATNLASGIYFLIIGENTIKHTSKFVVY
jgi:hypothetical protein